MDAAKGGRSNHPGPRLKSEISRGISHSEISKLTDEYNDQKILFIVFYVNSWAGNLFDLVDSMNKMSNPLASSGTPQSVPGPHAYIRK